MTPEQVLKAIEPKSDQLNADDLIGCSVVVTIKEVRRGDEQQKIVLIIDGGLRPYKPSKSMARVIVQLFGADPIKWVGQSLELYRDPTVKWAGVAVGGIRISGATIERDTELMVTISKTKREAIKIKAIKVANDPSERIEKAIVALRSAVDLETLGKYWASIERDLLPVATPEQTSKLSETYEQRLKDFEVTK